jgi:hypothetical protein
MGEWFRAGPHPSGWDFEHYHKSGDYWHAMGHGPGDARMGLDYTKRPGDKVEFRQADNEYNEAQNPEHAALIRQHVLDFHGATEHEPPPPKQKRRIYYHGTTVKGVTHILPASHIGVEKRYHETDPNYAYATTSLEDAWFHAGNATYDGGRPRVYQVRPIGGHKHVEKDPDEYPDGTYRSGVMDGDHRSAKGFEVVREMKAPKHLRPYYPGHDWDD